MCYCESQFNFTDLFQCRFRWKSPRSLPLVNSGKFTQEKFVVGRNINAKLKKMPLEMLSFPSQIFLVAHAMRNCYVQKMEKNIKRFAKWSIEKKALVALTILFVGVIASSWIYAMNFRQTIVANNAITTVDPTALIELERVRNIADSQVSNSRSFFLLGSSALFDLQKKERQNLIEALASFEKNYNLPQVPQILQQIRTLVQQQDEIFDQAMEFREKKTESKIVGQFYQAKINPLRAKVNDNLNEIAKIHNGELDRAKARAAEAARDAEVRIPQGMTWFTGSVALLFMALALLVLRMLRERSRQVAERDRLFTEAKKAVQDRDEVLAAVAYDLNEPLNTLRDTAESLPSLSKVRPIEDSVELMKSSISEIDRIISDIFDQKKADMGELTLRMDQLSIDDLLDTARMALQPLAKQRDIRLQIDSVNPPVLAFFDKERVVRVLANLIGNAIKFSDRHSKVVVKVRSDQQFVNISVADSGPGIPENQRAGIFDNFWQAKKTAAQGPGIGLSIVKTIVEAHGGTVKLESHVGHGSTFTFSLPRRRPVGANIKRASATVRHSPRPVDHSIHRPQHHAEM